MVFCFCVFVTGFEFGDELDGLKKGVGSWQETSNLFLVVWFKTRELFLLLEQRKPYRANKRTTKKKQQTFLGFSKDKDHATEALEAPGERLKT